MYDEMINSAVCAAKSADSASKYCLRERPSVPGMTSIGVSSSFAAVVAIPDNAPNLVVKVVDDPEDGFLLYATLCHKGICKGEHHLKVHSITKVDDLHVVIMERLEENRDNKSTWQDGDYIHARIDIWCDEIETLCGPYYSSARMDVRQGNVLWRKNRAVIVDPLGYTELNQKGEDLLNEYYG